jgi:hypothetical protein
MPDEEILRFLSQYINVEEILTMKECILDYLKQNIAPYYEGDIGVDMFVYQEDGKMKWHPFVEMNMRKTMGLAAHDIYARYCHPESRGTFRILRGSVETRLIASLQQNMQLRDGLWWSGTAMLNPITFGTQYAVVVTL